MKKNILLIEDFPVHQMLEEEALRDNSREVTVVSDDVEAIRKIDEQLALAPDDWLIVLDLRLLGDDLAGLRIIQHLEDHDNEAITRIPLLIASANSAEKTESELRARELRMRPILEKPFDMQDFIKKVKEVENIQ